MSRTSSFSSTGSGTSTSVAVGTSTSVSVATSTGDESSSSSTAITTTMATSSPDDSDGLAAAVGGEASALGDDTLAAGSISAAMIDDGSVTSVDLSATMEAVSEDDESAFAWADTFAGVSDGAEVIVGYTVENDSSHQSSTGSTAISTSTTNVTAYDIHPDTEGDAASQTDSASGDDAPLTDGQQESRSGSIEDDASLDLDGNIALLEVDAVAVGDDSFVGVDAYLFAIEDELSISGADVELGVG